MGDVIDFSPLLSRLRKSLSAGACNLEAAKLRAQARDLALSGYHEEAASTLRDAEHAEEHGRRLVAAVKRKGEAR